MFTIFNNGNSKTNGEEMFFLTIKDSISTIFDVGCRNDTEFLSFEGEVHYFDPVKEYIDSLSLNTSNKNKKSIYNNFGLGNENKELFYYPIYQSFYNRINSCGVDDDKNKVKLIIKKAKDYIKENNIDSIDFLKIDTEGYEFDVLKGFEECLKNVKIIQFEYGGTYLDNNTHLLDVIHYLESYGFHKFSYLTGYGTEPIVDFKDHYQYCNIVCINKSSDYNPL